jgi:hypothetical protein
MEVLDTATGAVQPVGPTGLVSEAGLPSGEIVASQYTQLRYAGTAAPLLSQVVLVDPSTGMVTVLSGNSTSEFVGIATH